MALDYVASNPLCLVTFALIMTLSYQTRTVRGVHVVDLAGRLCAGEPVTVFRKAVSGLVHEDETKLVLNLSDVSYIDSAGLEELILIHQSLKDSGGTVMLSNASKRVRNLLEITNLSAVLNTHDSEESAIDALAGAARGMA